MAKSITHSFFHFPIVVQGLFWGIPHSSDTRKTEPPTRKRTQSEIPVFWNELKILNSFGLCVYVYIIICVYDDIHIYIYIYAIMTYWYIVKYVIYLSSTHGESFRSSELPKRNPTRWSREAMKARSNSRAGAWKWSSWIPLARRPMWPWRPWLCGFRVFHTRCITVESTIWTGHEKSQEICLRHKG